MGKPLAEANPIFEGFAMSPQRTMLKLYSFGKNVNATAPSTQANAA